MTVGMGFATYFGQRALAALPELHLTPCGGPLTNSNDRYQGLDGAFQHPRASKIGYSVDLPFDNAEFSVYFVAGIGG